MTTLWVLLVIAGLAQCVLFMVAYHLKTAGRWRHFIMGRHLMGFIAAMTVCFALLALALIMGSLGPVPWVLAMLGINVVLGQRNWLLLAHNWESDHHKEGEPS